MYQIGQEVTVISDKGIAYDGYIMASATSDDGEKAYKIVIEGAGLTQLGQWHKSCDVFMVDSPDAVSQPTMCALQCPPGRPPALLIRSQRKPSRRPK